MRLVLPALRRIYGLTWAEIETMPAAERAAYLDDLALLIGDDPEGG